MTEKSISFYGKRLPVRQGAMALRPGEEPPEIVVMTWITIACPLARYDHSTEHRPCGRVIEIPVDLAPCAVICPECCGLLFVDESQREYRYAHYDLSFDTGEGQSVFGYAVYPHHPAQRSLHRMIQEFTSGHSVLVAPMYNDEAKEMMRLGWGRFLKFPSGKSVDDLAELHIDAVNLAAGICQKAHRLDPQTGQGLALALGQRAVAIAPASGFGFATVGVAYQQMGQWRNAIKAYQRALEAGFEAPYIHLNLGLAQGTLGDSDAEIAEYQRAIAIDPTFVLAHMNLAVEYASRQQWDDAIRHLRIVLDLEPANVQARLNLSGAYVEQGDWARAIRECRAVIRTSPDCADAYHNLGVGYLELGQLDEAVQSFARAVHIEPTNPESHYALGLALWQMRRSEEAIREWQIAARLGHGPARDQLAIAMQ